MKNVKIDLSVLERFEDRLKKQSVNLALENASHYAKEKMIKAWMTSEYTRRTGNLDDSFCWVVAYKGKVMDYGFLTDSVTAKGGRKTHEGGTERGREQAKKFISQYAPQTNNLEIVFASTMFYSGYLEEGTQLHDVYQVLRGIQGVLEKDFGIVNVYIEPIK
jgi:hypothetical protein